MADELLLDYNPVSGLTEWISTDEETGKSYIRYEQDTSAILDFNKEAQADSFDRRSEMWHAAKIPDIILLKWLTEHGVDAWDKNHAEGVKRLLNSNEYRYLRVKNFII